MTGKRLPDGVYYCFYLREPEVSDVSPMTVMVHELTKDIVFRKAPTREEFVFNVRNLFSDQVTNEVMEFANKLGLIVRQTKFVALAKVKWGD